VTIAVADTRWSADASRVWTYPYRVAAAASWRLAVTVAVVAVVPTTALALLLLSCGLAVIGPLWLVAITVVFAGSYFLHELAHALAYWWIARATDRSAEMIPDGSFGHARIIRWSLGANEDAVTSLAGPLIALAAGLPMLLVPAPFIAVFPIFSLFLVHAGSLRPGHADGAQARAVFRPGVINAHRV